MRESVSVDMDSAETNEIVMWSGGGDGLNAMVASGVGW
jgi:hypothetical protein